MNMVRKTILSRNVEKISAYAIEIGAVMAIPYRGNNVHFFLNGQTACGKNYRIGREPFPEDRFNYYCLDCLEQVYESMNRPENEER